ncbi:hypothetical protein EVAR_45338_1 [Eumeta japonica]|uniref:Uncharacterized protein n=1 Tax=Eumeta variegata TaxID=151549 RepID=A0A4C1XME0_EUMVA|nr:hypothetical protein EVAR_45338_1 [Eumeta japonica]
MDVIPRNLSVSEIGPSPPSPPLRLNGVRDRRLNVFIVTRSECFNSTKVKNPFVNPAAARKEVRREDDTTWRRIDRSLAPRRREKESAVIGFEIFASESREFNNISPKSTLFGSRGDDLRRARARVCPRPVTSHAHARGPRRYTVNGILMGSLQ